MSVPNQHHQHQCDPRSTRSKNRIRLPLWLLLLAVPFSTWSSALIMMEIQSQREHRAAVESITGVWADGSLQLSFDDGTFHVTDRTRAFAGRFTVEPGEGFHFIRMVTFPDGRRMHGAYSVSGSNLRLRLLSNQQPVPTSLDDAHGFYVSLQRK